MEKGKIAVIPMPLSAGNIQLTVIDDSLRTDINNLSLPHRHDYYCCFIATAGFGKFKVDFQVFELSGPCILILYPGQVHELIEESGIEGWSLNFSAEIVNDAPKSMFEQAVAPLGIIETDQVQTEWFASLLSLMNQALSLPASDFNNHTIQAMTNAFFYRSAELFNHQENQRVVGHSIRKLEIVRAFRSLVRSNFHELKRPVDYAKRINVTVSHLNDTVKSVTGFSATCLIQQEVFTEAQRLLYYTTGSIKEISYALGFEDEKYFSKLFQKRKGVSPTVFRKSIVP